MVKCTCHHKKKQMARPHLWWGSTVWAGRATTREGEIFKLLAPSRCTKGGRKENGTFLGSSRSHCQYIIGSQILLVLSPASSSRALHQVLRNLEEPPPDPAAQGVFLARDPRGTGFFFPSIAFTHRCFLSSCSASHWGFHGIS